MCVTVADICYNDSLNQGRRNVLIVVGGKTTGTPDQSGPHRGVWGESPPICPAGPNSKLCMSISNSHAIHCLTSPTLSTVMPRDQHSMTSSMPCSTSTFISGTVLVNGHTMLKTPVLVRSPKLSNIGRGQYLDGWPLGNTTCRWQKLFLTFYL